MRLTLDFLASGGIAPYCGGDERARKGRSTVCRVPRNTHSRDRRASFRVFDPQRHLLTLTPNTFYFRASFLQFWLLALEIVFMLLIVLKLFRELRWLCRNGLIEWLASVRRRGRHADSSPLSPQGSHCAPPAAGVARCRYAQLRYPRRRLCTAAARAHAHCPRGLYMGSRSLISTPTSTRWATPSTRFRTGSPSAPSSPTASSSSTCRSLPRYPLPPPLARCVANPTFPLSLPSNGAWHMHNCTSTCHMHTRRRRHPVVYHGWMPRIRRARHQHAFFAGILHHTHADADTHAVGGAHGHDHHIFIAHMLALYHAFGGTLRTFSTPFDALNTMFSLVLGEFDPREIEEANPDVGKTIFLLFMFFFFFLLCAAAICRVASSPARVPACAPSNEPIPPSFADPGTT